MFGGHPIITLVALRRLRAEASASQGVDEASATALTIACGLPVHFGADPGTDPLAAIGQMFDDQAAAAGNAGAGVLAVLNWMVANCLTIAQDVLTILQMFGQVPTPEPTPTPAGN